LSSNTNTITQMLYGNNEEVWRGIDLDSFQVEDLDDMQLIYSDEKTVEQLEEMIRLPKNFDEEDVVLIKEYNWQNSAYKRNMVAIEFIDNDALRNFVDVVFKPRRKSSVRKEDVYLGELDAKDEDYSNPYLVQENRFVFMVFGPELYSDNAINKIIDYYPSQYQYTSDDDPPEIIVHHPSSRYTNQKDLAFTVLDRESGMNPLSISVMRSVKAFDPLKDCRKKREVSFDEFTCIIEDGLRQGKDDILIAAADREYNTATRTIPYVYDVTEPTIEIEDDNAAEELLFNVQDNINISLSGISVESERKSIPLDNCRNEDTGFFCRTSLTQHAAQGENTFTISARDAAGNSASRTITTIIDTKDPVIRKTRPGSNYSSDKIIEFYLLDGESGIGTYTIRINGKELEDICRPLSEKRYLCKHMMEDEIVELIVTLSDRKGNTIEETMSIVSDFTPPSISITAYETGEEGSISFSITDLLSGIEGSHIDINGNQFTADSICEGDKHSMECYYEMPISNGVTITARDIAGNEAIARKDE
ncbi:MAG: Ig-like domain-containing protein, partial [Nanoarchaeota archaeon]